MSRANNGLKRALTAFTLALITLAPKYMVDQ